MKHLLEHQTARPFKIEVWTTAAAPKPSFNGLNQDAEQKNLEVLNKLGTLEKCGDLLTKHVPRAVLDKLAGKMEYTFPDAETRKFQEYANINQNHWNRKMAAVVRLPVFDDGKNESLEDDVRSSLDTTSHLTTAVSRRSEMNIQKQPYLHGPP